MRPRGLALAGGAILILVANGVALTGVAYNRGGEPESRIDLSQRELARPWDRRGSKEDSGLSLRLAWRVPARDVESHDDYGGHRGSPAWLDEKRMAELGFDVDRAKRNNVRRKYGDRSERRILVVLELAGTAWQQALEQARQRLARRESLRQANPEARELAEPEKRAREGLAREENESSRLFAVDAGADLTALRTKYPDRSRYLILEGRLRLHTVFHDKKPTVGGDLRGLSVDRINVPHALRGAFESMPARDVAGKTPPFTATVAVGRRLEPWIEAVATP